VRLGWSTVLADEDHEFLRGQYCPKLQLQYKNKSMFIISISGIPFVINPVHEFGAMTRGAASELIRHRRPITAVSDSEILYRDRW
jgi:hypothetical protein